MQQRSGAPEIAEPGEQSLRGDHSVDHWQIASADSACLLFKLFEMHLYWFVLTMMAEKAIRFFITGVIQDSFAR